MKRICLAAKVKEKVRGATVPALFGDLIPLEDLLASMKNAYAANTIYQWIHRDGMPHVKLRGKLWFDPNAVRSWMERTSV